MVVVTVGGCSSFLILASAGTPRQRGSIQMNTYETTNTIGKILKGIGIAYIVISITFLLVASLWAITANFPATEAGYVAAIVWSVALGSTLGGLLIMGFGEVVNLLQGIKNNTQKDYSTQMIAQEDLPEL